MTLLVVAALALVSTVSGALSYGITLLYNAIERSESEEREES